MVTNEVPQTRLAVCSWSLQAPDPGKLAARLLETGLRRVQVALDPLREAPDPWLSLPRVFEEHKITMVSGMFGCVGEDYTTLDSIRRTGGLAPDQTWDQNREIARASAALAGQLGLHLVTFHAGFLPHDQDDPDFAKMLGRLSEVADIFSAAQIQLGLETGQETAPVLRRLLVKLNRPNVGVNFDPANMILYGKGDPVDALNQLGPWIRQVHIKDAIAATIANQWGSEVPAGTGQVDWAGFFATLDKLGYRGEFVIEREAGNQRVADIRQAKTHVSQYLG